MSDKIMQYNTENRPKSRQRYSNIGYKEDVVSETAFSFATVSSDPLQETKCSPKEKKRVILKTNQYTNVNNFRFEFNIKYNTIVEQNIYPKLYQKFNIDGYPVMQRTGDQRTVCLTCPNELRIGGRSIQNLFGHISGQRHQNRTSLPSVIKNLQNYHEIFLNFESNLQAHQVYFVPDNDSNLMKCILCMLFVKRHEVRSHILNEPHKQNVMCLRNAPMVNNSFYLLDQHLQVYGIEYERNNLDKKREYRKPKTHIYRTEKRKDVDDREHEIVKSIVNPNDDNPLKTLPRRFDQHMQYLKNGGPKVTCIACITGGTNIPKNKIISHLILSSHLESTKLELLNYLFFCEICDLKFYDEMAWHTHFEKIPEKHRNIAPSRRENVCEHECLTCRVIIYGDTLSLRRHKNSNTRKIEKNKGSFLSEETKQYFGSKNIINENGQKLLDDVTKTVDEQEYIFELCSDLEEALSGYFVNCKAHPFGSRISGLGNTDSDLDVFIDIGGMYDGVQKQSEEKQKRIINTALELFKTNRKFYNISSRPSARTPIIRLKHRPTELDCDISFRHGLSVENTQFLRFCFQLQPISQELILLLKKWSHLCFLHERITTYALAMLAIFYLQTENYLVSVGTVKKLNPIKSRVIDGWDTITYTAPIGNVRDHIKMYNGDIVNLLSGFFKYYSDFNYKAHVICPLLGRIVLKSQFIDDPTGELLPEEMESYKKKINMEEFPEYFRSMSEFCIQDPFDLSHNLTKACSQTIVEKFKQLCSLTYELLEKH